MKIAVCQLRVKSNNPESNVASMKYFINEARNKADMIVFPELCISGYMVGDRFAKPDFIHEMESFNDEIKELSKDIGILWGNVHMREGKLFNAAYFAYNGSWVERADHAREGIYTKHLLPNYQVFDDKRYFESGDGNFEPFIFKGDRIAVQICEDLWDEQSPIKPTQKIMEHMPDVIINISCSPWTKGKEAKRIKEINRKDIGTTPFVYVNAVGTQNNGKNVVSFDGGSIVKWQRNTMKLSDSFEETLHYIDLENPKNADETIDNKRYQALIKGIQYFDEETLPYKPKWIVGVSGGLDSSVTVALLSIALGKDRVIGVTMPSNFTRDITKNNAYFLSKKLGFELKEIPIGGMVEATCKALEESGYTAIEGLTYENIQARLRGHTLMSVSSLENGVVSNNGNKIEVALGYATLYGDAIGALAILGDLTKLEVGDVARVINKLQGCETVPENLIPNVEATSVSWGFAPSAELAEDQFDPMKWGYHDYLIEMILENDIEFVLEDYYRNSFKGSPIHGFLENYGLLDDDAFLNDLDWVVRTMNTAIYKRVQMPPILVMSETAFGLNIRENQGVNRISKKAQHLKRVIRNGME